GGNNFQPGVSSFRQPAHAFGANKRRGTSYSGSLAVPIHLLLGANSSKVVPARRNRSKDGQIPANVPLGTRPIRSQHTSGGGGRHAAHLGLCGRLSGT